MATGLFTSSHSWQNEFIAHLTADITSSSTDIFLDNIPTGTEGALVIDPDTPGSYEVIFFTSKTGTKVTVPSVANGRGYDNSTASAHLSGTKVIMAPIADDFNYMRTLSAANATYLAAGGGYDFVASGAVITADAAGSTLLATMTSGTCYIGGSPVTIPASTSRAYTANNDTYVDVSSAGALTFTAVANNAASPALAASSIRLGIVVAGATSIAAAASINQGQESRVLPIASSIPYAVTDSLGNLICPRDPQRKVLGYRQIVTNFVTSSATAVQVTGLSVPVIVPTARKVKITAILPTLSSSASPTNVYANIWDGVVVSGTRLQEYQDLVNTNANGRGMTLSAVTTPTTSSKTYNLGVDISTSTLTIIGQSTAPAFILVELI